MQTSPQYFINDFFDFKGFTLILSLATKYHIKINKLVIQKDQVSGIKSILSPQSLLQGEGS